MQIEQLKPVWAALEKAGIDPKSTHVRKLGLSRVGDVVHVFNYGLSEQEKAAITKAIGDIGLEVVYHEGETVKVTPGGY